ncbi:MAG: hypothetical protein WC373_04675 [Smithella sp.]|jgi:hypothetical protein
MKTIMVREFKELTDAEKDKIRNSLINSEIEFLLEMLSQNLNNESITEDEYWKEIGCSKYYGESTSWFVPSVYYDKHKEDVDQAVEELLSESVFDSNGRIVAVEK